MWVRELRTSSVLTFDEVQLAVDQLVLVPPSLLCSTKEPYIKCPNKEPYIKEDVMGPRIGSEYVRPSTVQVAVPDDMVAMFIGKGGEHIKRLQTESGCEIHLPLESPGSWHRLSVCYITGSPEAIVIAQDLIYKMIKNTRFKKARRKDNISEASSRAGFKPKKSHLSLPFKLEESLRCSWSVQTPQPT